MVFKNSNRTHNIRLRAITSLHNSHVVSLNATELGNHDSSDQVSWLLWFNGNILRFSGDTATDIVINVTLADYQLQVWIVVYAL